MPSSSHELLLDFIGRDDGASSVAERIAQHLRDIPERTEAKIDVDAGGAQAEIDALQLRLLALRDQVIEGKFDGTEALAEATAIKTELAAIFAGADTREIRLDTLGFFADVEMVEARLKAIPDEKVTIEVDTDRSLTSKLSGIGDALKGVFGGLSGGGGVDASAPLSALGGLLDKSTVSFGFFTTTAKAGASIMAVLIPIVFSLVGALGAMVAGLAAAAAAVGTLAVAAAAVALPLAAIAIGAVTRFKSMSDAIEEAKTATDALKTAEEAHADAVRNVDAAERSVRQAEDGLSDARKAAAEQIRNDLTTALEGVRQASIDLDAAQRDELEAQQALTDAREAATRALVDQRLAAEGAALSEQRAKIALNEAERELKRLRGDPSATDKEIRLAKLAVKEAELSLNQAQVDRTRSQEDLNEAEAKGVEGSDQVVAAKQAIADAEAQVVDARNAYADATLKLVDAEQATVRQSDSVVAARRAVVTANRSLNDSQRALADSAGELAQKQREADKALAAAKDVTPQFYALRDAIDSVKRAFDTMIGAGVDKIFGGLAKALDSLSPLLRRLRGAFAQLGGAVGKAFQRIASELASPKWAAFFESLIGSAKSAVGPLAGSFIGLLRVLRNIAQAAMPFFIAGLKSISGGLRGLGKSSESLSLAPLFEQLGTWLEVFKQLGRVIVNFFGAALPFAKEIGDAIGTALENTADWLASTDGKNSIADFFEATLPLAGKVVEVVGKIIAALFQFTEFAAPIFEPILEAVGTFFDAINFILGLLNKIPVPFRRFIGLIISVFVGLGKIGVVGKVVRFVLGLIVAVADRVVNGFGKVGDIFKWVVGKAGELVEFLKGVPGKVFNAAKGIASGIFNGVKTLGGKVLAFISDKFNAVVNFIRSVPGRIFNLVKQIPGKIIAALSGLGGLILGFFRDKFNAVTDFFASLPSRFFDLGVDIMQGLWDGIKALSGDVADEIKDAALGPLGFIADKLQIRSPSRVMHELGFNVMKGFANGLRSAMGDVALASAGIGAVPMIAAGGGNRRGGGNRNLEMVNNFNVAGGGSPDPDATIAAISLGLRRRGLDIS